MNVDYRLVGVALIVAVAVGSGAYVMGQRQGAQAVAASAPERSAGQTTGVAGKEASKFAQFAVGGRNVKSMFAEGPYLWLGTSGGVWRYDTRTDQVKVYDNKTPGILSNGVFHVSRLGERILAGTYGGGLSVLDPATDQWRNLNIPNGLADQFVYDVVAAQDGDVWIATWSGVNRVRAGRFDDPKAWTSFTVENTQGGLPNPWVYAADQGPDGTLWFATEEGLARYQDGRWTNWQHAAGLGAPYDVVKDAIRLTNDPAKASQHHARQKSEQGLSAVNVAYNPNYIISLAVDRAGVVWAGTWGGGLARFDGKSWRNYTHLDGLPANHILMLHIDPQGTLWVGTNQGLARMNADGSFTVLTTKDGLYADNVFSMTAAADGSLWIGSFGGVAHLAALSRTP